MAQQPGRSAGRSNNRAGFKRYHEVRVRVQFREKPPIGWLKDHALGLRRFPRDDEQNIVFDCRYWRGMIASGIAMFADELFERFPSLMNSIWVEDVRGSQPALGIVEDFGEVWEQLPASYELSASIYFPVDVWDGAAFQTFLEKCGRVIGWCPVHSADGYGRFRVLGVEVIR